MSTTEATLSLLKTVPYLAVLDPRALQTLAAVPSAGDPILSVNVSVLMKG